MVNRDKIILPKYTSTPTGYDIEGVGHFPRVSNILECGKLDNGILDKWRKKVFNKEVDSFLTKSITAPELIKTGMLNAYSKPDEIANQSAEFGSVMHEFMETYVNTGKFIDVKSHPYASTDICKQSMMKFIQDWGITPEMTLKAECLIWSSVYGYAGCIDYIANPGNGIFILDWKTSNHLSDRYYLQTVAYWVALEERFKEWGIDEKVSGVFIIRFAKDKPFYEYLSFDSKMKEKYFSVFKSCLNIYNFSNSDGKTFEVF